MCLMPPKNRGYSRRWVSFSYNYGLTINTKKIEVLYQPAPGNPIQEPNITVKGQRLQALEHFSYLGNTLSRSTKVDDAEINSCLAKASSAFGRLRKTVWE